MRRGGGVLTFEKVDGLVGNKITSQVLCSIHKADDTSSVRVDTLPQVQKGRITLIRFEVDSSLDHGNGLVGVELILASETFERFGRLLHTTFADEPPW